MSVWQIRLHWVVGVGVTPEAFVPLMQADIAKYVDFSFWPSISKTKGARATIGGTVTVDRENALIAAQDVYNLFLKAADTVGMELHYLQELWVNPGWEDERGWRDRSIEL